MSSSIAPGDSDTFTVQLDTTTAGPKSGQITFSTNDSNENPFNFSISGVVDAPSVDLPDLTLTTLAGLPSSIAPGNSATVHYYVTNVGGAAAPASTSGIYLSTDQTITSADRLIGSDPLQAINANTHLSDPQAITFTIPGDVTAGTYYLGVLADYSDQIVEADETNNVSTVLPLPVTAPAKPDLTITNLSVVETAATLGQTITISFDLNNIGTADATGFDAGFYISPDQTIDKNDELFAYASYASQAANSSTPHSGTAPLPSDLTPGQTYYIGLIVDDTSKVAELSEDNNTSNVDSIAIQPSQVAIETSGATDLTQVGSNYYLYDHGTTTGPTLKYGGAAYVAGQGGAWVPIGAEAITGGYGIAWKNGSADQYTGWIADGDGNYVSSLAVVPGTNPDLQVYEVEFQQDLNGDGTIGPTTTLVVESSGSTSLAMIGNEYFFLNATGFGPSLWYSGAPVASGQLGGWTPIGAEATAGGYEVAWKNGSADQYAVWSTDSSGNYQSLIANNVAGTSQTLEALEPSFQQDLNGDGTIGFPTTVIEAAGATDLSTIGSTYYLYAHGTTTGPTLKLSGSAFVAGQLGGWTPIGAEATAGGYEVAWKNGSADQYAVWSTDSSGNYQSLIANNVAGTSQTLEALEPSFQQDLNGDGTIGFPTTVIEAAGATDLSTIGSTYYLYAHGTTTGPTLKLSGSAFVAGQLGGWTPIGAEATAGGYEVAWKNGSADQYAVWSTDSSGNYQSLIANNVAGTSQTLEALEPSFQQDLNGDGTIGFPTTVIEAAGATDLSTIGSTYYLYAHGTTTGPTLKLSGSAFVAGQLGGWTPIGAEATASGYEVAWKNGSADQYAVWSTDSSGNYQSLIANNVAGTSQTLEALEPSFQQDLNGDGTIGFPTTVIEAAGATDLSTIGSTYYLYAHGTTTGPTLKLSGSAFVAGQLGGWTPIGAEATAGGYEVAWKNGSADQYAVWSTDSSGNYQSLIANNVAGTSSTLEALEPSFQQDLNGDGGIGSPTIAAGETFEIISSYNGVVSFTGATGTLKLDRSTDFSGTVAGLANDDAIDFADINFATLIQPVYSGTSSSGTLTVADDTRTANVALLGNYLASSFVATNDGHGGTMVVDPVLPVLNQQTILTLPQHA